MSWIFAIDPGNIDSGYVLTDDNLKPVSFGKVKNEELLQYIRHGIPAGKDIEYCIEMIASYGMPVGKEVFDTCVWIGRVMETVLQQASVLPVYIYRREEKLEICHSPKATDATIRQALVDRFAFGTPNYGKGTKREPGWFYGFKADIWQAYAVAVTFHDKYIGGADEQ